MEDTILGAFDKLASTDPNTVNVGVEDIDKLIKERCNLGVPSSNTTKRKAFTSQLNTSEIKEFVKLQDSFAFNIVSRLAASINKVDEDSQKVLLLNTIEGLCLLHHPSRNVFSTDKFMKALVGQLSPKNSKSSKVQVAAINALVSVMVRHVDNIRKFETIDGLGEICALFKSKDTPKDVKVEILEFLFFYLIPETKVKSLKPDRKTTEEKSQLLGKYLSNVTGLVRELNTSTPFCDMDLEW